MASLEKEQGTGGNSGNLEVISMSCHLTHLHTNYSGNKLEHLLNSSIHKLSSLKKKKKVFQIIVKFVIKYHLMFLL